MKKFLFPLAVVVVLLCASCRDKAHIMTTYYQVHREYWTPMTYPDDLSLTAYYYAKFEAPDITSWVIDNGVVNCYYYNDGLQEPLPYTTYNLDTASGALYSERLEFDMEPGYVYFILKDNDFATENSIRNIPTVNIRMTVIENY
ncbi:MAG: hypothetical protein IJV22_07070 [Bacteroidales bacterium]|nr:hypothetical protein [Bacteroidales bacterium]